MRNTWPAIQTKKNGLCWDSKDEEKPSLLGPMVAGACKTEMKRMIREFLLIRILLQDTERQVKDAPGGSYDYVWMGK